MVQSPVAEPKTVATAIRIGNPASWEGAIAARDESRGAIEAIDDDGILSAYRLLARTEGLFAEPASAISVAGALRLAETGRLKAGKHLGEMLVAMTKIVLKVVTLVFERIKSLIFNAPSGPPRMS